MAERPKKKTVRVESTPETAAASATWAPTPEAKRKAVTFRIIAAVLWVLAIAGEAFAIFWVLRQSPVNMVILIVLIVVIGGLAIGGSMLWKQANRLDPASRGDKVRFFVQNQLGAIITIIAFLPLIILILLNKDMSGAQKGIAAGIAGVVLVVATLLGISWNPPSVEQYDQETNFVVELTGENLVFWTKSGKVYHLCEEASAVNIESKDGTIYSGTVADAHAAGKDRLTLQVDVEIEQCGLTPLDDATDAPAEQTEDAEPTPEPTPAP